MHFSKWFIPAAMLLALMVESSVAQGQRLGKLPFRNTRQESPGESYQLRDSDGPWLIMCASFGGENGRAGAQRLAQELRDMKLKAYVFEHEFDRPEVVEGVGWEMYVDDDGTPSHRPKTMRHASAQFEEIAVLVGDFPSIDDARAQKLLEQIKRLKPKSLDPAGEEPGSQRLRNWREFARMTSNDPENQEKGPMRAAFLMPNPLLPDEYFAANRIDHFVLELNERVKYSLLDNPQPYSVRVATFRGDTTFELNEIEEKQRELQRLRQLGKGIRESKLTEAAVKANKLTVALREMGVDAYEFHDRNESYVCVGGFEWVTKGEGPEQIYNPEVARVVEKFKGSIVDLPNMKGALQPKQLKQFKKTNIVFDVQPIPVQVPQAPVHTADRGRWR